MAMDIGAKGGVRSDINVTPLVDVVLVLLIIFMVITPMLQRGKAVKLPEAKHVAENQGGDPILLSVTNDGKIWLDKVEVQKAELVDKLKEERLKAGPSSTLVVK